jgi:hypothetical protein
MVFLRWLFWRAYYLLPPYPRDLSGFLLFQRRTRCPWKKFKPYMYHSDNGEHWDVWFNDAMCYTKRVSLPVEIDVCNETGQIVGLTIFDEVVKQDWREVGE